MQINSSRAKKILSDLKYLKSETIEGLQVSIKWTNELKFESGEYTSSNQIESILFETIFMLCMGENISRVINLSLREVDSFLRDDNQSTAFIDKEAELAKAFDSVKNEVLLSLFEEVEGELDWDCSLVEKVKSIKAIMESLHSRFLDLSYTLISVHGQTVAINPRNALSNDLAPVFLTAMQKKVVKSELPTSINWVVE